MIKTLLLSSDQTPPHLILACPQAKSLTKTRLTNPSTPNFPMVLKTSIPSYKSHESLRIRKMS